MSTSVWPAWRISTRLTGVVADQGSGGASVVQVDVGEQDGVQVGDSETLLLQGLTEVIEGRGWTGVDQGAMARGLEQGGGYGVRAAGPEGVQGVDGVHGFTRARWREVLILMEGEGWLVNILLADTPTPGVFCITFRT